MSPKVQVDDALDSDSRVVGTTRLPGNLKGTGYIGIDRMG